MTQDFYLRESAVSGKANEIEKILYLFDDPLVVKIIKDRS